MSDIKIDLENEDNCQENVFKNVEEMVTNSNRLIDFAKRRNKMRHDTIKKNKLSDRNLFRI